MTVNFVEKKRKQQYMLFMVSGVIVVAFIVLWFGYFNKPAQAPPPEEIVISKKNIFIDYSVLENPILDALVFFRETPLYEGMLGKENPFLPR